MSSLSFFRNSRAAGWNSSIGFPEGSSKRICEPPGPEIDVVAEAKTGASEATDLSLDVLDDQGYGSSRRAQA